MSSWGGGSLPSLETARVFQARKRRALRWGGATFLLGATTLVATMAGTIDVPTYLSVLVAGGGAVIGFSYLSCPACKKVPFAERSSFWADDGGIVPNPEFCPSCGVRLR